MTNEIISPPRRVARRVAREGRATALLDRLLEKHAPLDRARRHGRVAAERGAAGEAGAFVEADGGPLDVAGLESEAGDTPAAGFFLQAGENGQGHATATGLRPDVHALDLGEAVVQRDAAAADGAAVEAGDEEQDVRPEDAREAEAVALLGRIRGVQFGVQFLDQRSDVIGR